MKILLLESFYASSHKQWADGLVAHSNHDIHLMTLPGRHWKWRMHHSGKYFAFEISQLKSGFDLIICTDFMNVAEFRGTLSAIGNSDSWFNHVPVITYFHENQITYPWSEDDPDIDLKRDNHYGWINYMTAICSDYLMFNSQFHKSSFIQALPQFLSQFPKVAQEDGIHAIAEKSSVFPIGLDLAKLSQSNRSENKSPVILWNHRWEYDKNPDLFFETLFELQDQEVDFKLIVVGEKFKSYPKIFDTAKKKLTERIIHFGYAKNRSQYIQLLLLSDVLPVTSNQDFFGISVVEGIAAGCLPILPNRLAFPEHLDKEEHNIYYYDNQKDLKQKLIFFLQKNQTDRTDLRNYILKYDWSKVGPDYDKYFDEIIA